MSTEKDPFGAPRVCGDDPSFGKYAFRNLEVLPAYAGMIHRYRFNTAVILEVLPAYAGMIPRLSWECLRLTTCSPRMRG